MFDAILVKVSKYLFKTLSNNYRVKASRKLGVKLGDKCRISGGVEWSTEPYLIEIGDHVTIAGGVIFLTHDGAIWVFRDKEPNIDLFGKIKVGNNCVIALNTLIMPNTTIGNNCVIGAGAVVRGVIPDNSVVIGNPGKVVMSTAIYYAMIKNNPGKIHTANIPDKKKKAIVLEHFSKLEAERSLLFNQKH
jgi:acetyltransferase-like isoleucine patch superfamily enzyme